MSYNVKGLREKIGELAARCQAILDSGELTDELRAELDRIQGQGEEGTEGFVAGEIHNLQKDLARAEKIEARTAELLKTRTQATVQQGGKQKVEGEQQDEQKAKSLKTPFARCEALTIPIRQQFRYGTLKAFNSPNSALNEKQAYLAGMFFLGAIGTSIPGLRDDRVINWNREHGIDLSFRNALGGENNLLGGVLVPDEVEQRVIDLREARGVARREAMVSPMSSDTKLVARRTGGLTAYFVGQNPSSGITESDKNWDNIELVAKTLATLTRYSIQLSDDAIISIGDDLTSEIAYAFADKEDECLFNGTGTSTYGGIVGLKSGTLAGSKVTAATGNTAFSTLDLADFEAMVGKLPTYAEPNAKWYVSKAGWAASMLRLVDAGGGNTWRDLADGKRELSFLGYPVVISQVMNSTLDAQTSTDGLVYFGDMRQAVTLGNRRGVSVFPSEHRYMEYNQIGIRGMQRFDLNYHERGTSTVAGSIIMLSTPGS
jgi:HK97 family phage major capsid protein